MNEYSVFCLFKKCYTWVWSGSLLYSFSLSGFLAVFQLSAKANCELGLSFLDLSLLLLAQVESEKDCNLLTGCRAGFEDDVIVGKQHNISSEKGGIRPGTSI
jgi:hypothetical protein